VSLSGFLRVALVFVILVVLHFTLRPLLAWRASPDFLLIAVLLIAIRVRPGTAAVVGFLVGIVADTLTLDAFGSTALAMSLVAFGSSWIKAVFFADDLALNAFFFFLGKWLFEIILLLTQQRAGGGELVIEMLVWAPLGAAVTALAGVVTLMLLRPILRTAAA
jgi:rod shape-determining protein MreD